MKYSIPGLKQSDFPVTRSVMNKRQRLSISPTLVCTLEDQHNCKISHVRALGQQESTGAGAGMIFSQGLMRMRSYEDIELAVRSMGWAHQGAGGQPFQP